MPVAEYIGDEISAAGYRLCGIDVHIADEHNTLTLVKAACARASLVLLGSKTALYINRKELEALMLNIEPPVMIVPDAGKLQSVPDITSLIYKQLGMLE
jgi:vacuolar-type H+-ATPase subunit F/Vma7